MIYHTFIMMGALTVATLINNTDVRINQIDTPRPTAQVVKTTDKPIEGIKENSTPPITSTYNAPQPSPAPVTAQASPRAVAPAPVASNAAKAFIYQHESGNNPSAINAGSGACGLGQALPCSKMGCSLSDYACQDAYFTSYMLGRYGSWENAYAFWISHSWW
jgi:hypothetical protein